LLSYNGALTNEQVYARLKQKADKVDALNPADPDSHNDEYGWGRLNLFAPLQVATTTPTQTATITLTATITQTPTVTNTARPGENTNTPTQTATSTLTATATSTPTSSPTGELTFPAITFNETTTATATATFSPTLTSTPITPPVVGGGLSGQPFLRTGTWWEGLWQWFIDVAVAVVKFFAR